MSSSTALPTAALVLGFASFAAIFVGASGARGGDIMALGFVALGLFAGAAVGLIGVIVAIVALKQGSPGRARAITGLVLSALPIVLLAGVMIDVRLSRPPELPMAPPTKPPEPPATPPAESPTEP